ncbi:hypothetical protein ACWDA3_18000 [Nonomuraea rubra]
MGTDWVPAAVRDLTGPAELDGLIRVHAHLSHALGRTLRTDPPEKIGHDTALRRWQDADARLRALLLLDTDAGGAHPSHRVAVIGANRLFPPEWRQAAWTTLSPAQLTGWSSRWRHWYASITAGRFRHYLARLRTWDTCRDLTEFQADLAATAHAAAARTNAWARKPAFLHARHLVRALPPPPTVPAPGPPPAAPADDRPVPGQRADEEAVARHLVLLEHSAREFSRTVPGPYKRALRLSPASDVEADPWLEGFFDWLAPVVRARRALYLWA